MTSFTPGRADPHALPFLSRLVPLLSVLVLALSLSTRIDAQERPAQEGKDRKNLQVTVEPCFGEHCTEGWFPVAVTIDNRTGNEVRGTLAIVLDTLVRWNEGEGEVATRMPVNCARGTTKKFIIYAHLPGGGDYYYGSWVTGATVEFWEAGETRESFRHDLRLEVEKEA
ncbi:MAG: hypothetical protein RDV41_13050, partial [Planctomycetota bacterium]|nr:hypothetical protein [Planctomycetota bacterium]